MVELNKFINCREFENVLSSLFYETVPVKRYRMFGKPRCVRVGQLNFSYILNYPRVVMHMRSINVAVCQIMSDSSSIERWSGHYRGSN
jgi:hypothetical protein